MTASVMIARAGSLLLLTLTRPEKKNALTGAMYQALSGALAEAATDNAVRAVVFTGSQGVFTAGNDIHDFLGSPGSLTDFPAMQFIRTLIGFEKPIVVAVDGLAIGIGTTLILHCDLVYATPSALFRMPFVDLGLVPEAGSSLLLPRRVGLARASELLLLGEPFGAEAALAMGLVNAIVDGEALVGHATTQALRLSGKPPAALRAARRLLRGDPAELLARVEEEATAFAAALAGPEARDRLQAFTVKASGAAPRAHTIDTDGPVPV